MGMPDWVLAVLRCPAKPDLRLAPAGADVIARLGEAARTGTLRDAGGRVVGPFDEALVREDGRVAYPVRDGIPFLTKEDGIEVPQAGDGP